jgi:Cu(I)/Ag(I) efflux system membrane fusion protein
MKNIIQNKYVIAIICLMIGIAAGLWFAPDQQAAKTHQHETKEGETYTCSMHPQVRQNEPGDCPICGMELIQVEESGNDESASAVKMSATAKKLANIQTLVVKRSEPVKTLRLDGEIVPDETADVSQAVHFEGRIEKLYADYEGKYISTGDEIGKVYSQEVMIAQRELLQAVESGNESLKNAAIAKLRNYKISKKSIDKILSSDKIYETLPIYAHKSGIITKVNVSEGDHVHKGDALYTLTDLSSVWLMLDLFEKDLQWVETGDSVQFEIEALPGQSFNGIIDYIDPIINSKTRTAEARVIVQNHKGNLKPGMFANATVKARLSGNSQITIPKSAVLWTGKRSVVYVSSKSDEFEMREVELGNSLGEKQIIAGGLKVGEEVVTNGAFYVDAAAQLANKTSMMNSSQSEPKSNGGSHNQISQLIVSYLALKDSLVNDNFEGAKKAAVKTHKLTENMDMKAMSHQAHKAYMEVNKSMKSNLKKAVTAEDIEPLRNTFLDISNSMIKLSKSTVLTDKLYIQHCPMANDYDGGDWLSKEKKIRNPYFGSSMLTCGSVTDEVN